MELIIHLLKHARLDAVLPGPAELALGKGALDQSLPYALSNAAHPAPLPSIRVLQRGGRRIGILGYLGPEEIYQGAQSDLRLERAGTPLLSRWRTLLLEHNVEVAVLLFRGTNDDLAVLVGSGIFDAVVSGNPSSDESQQVTERIAGGIVVPQVPTCT